MITRPGAYQNRPWPPPSVRSRSDRPATAPVHHRHSLPGTVATFARYRVSTAESAIAAATAVRPASSSRRTGTRSPAPGRRQPRRTVAALLRRSRVASRTLTVSPHHSTASLRDRPSRSVNSRSASPARFSVSITAWSRSPIATMTRSARSITRRTRSSRSRRRFSAIPRRTPRLLLDRLLTHLVLTRVDMDSDSHLRHFPGPRAITEPQKPSNPLPRPSQSSRSEPDAPAVTDTPLRPPKFPRPTKCHTPLASSDPRVFRLCETTVSPQSPGAFYGRP